MAGIAHVPGRPGPMYTMIWGVVKDNPAVARATLNGAPTNIRNTTCRLVFDFKMAISTAYYPEKQPIRLVYVSSF